MTTDEYNNIFVAGRFYGDGRFGHIMLPGKGEADVFVVKLTPAGTTLNAMTIGNSGFDAGTDVEVNSRGQALVSAYYYSNYLEIGKFSSSMLGGFAGDSFIATLSNDLTTVDCAKFITGNGESILSHFKLDPVDNVIVKVRLMLGNDPVHFGARTIADGDYSSAIAVLGRNAATDVEEMPDAVFPEVSLGPDTTLCLGAKLSLSVVRYCNTEYKWSTGASGTHIEVTKAGSYWVDVTRNGVTTRDDINVSYYDPVTVTLGEDQAICPGDMITWSLPVCKGGSYQWSDGGTSNEKVVMSAGTYWVQVSHACETARDSVTVSLVPEATVDLGSDIFVCKGEEVILRYAPAPGESLLWSDGSTAPSLMVMKSGAYALTVNNGCSEKTDEVVVTIKDPGAFMIPNVVTHDGDGKNDYFLLPSGLERCSLLICNRWGQKIFYADDYQDNWPRADVSGGVYFYTMRSDCMPESKGMIHLMQ